VQMCGSYRKVKIGVPLFGPSAIFPMLNFYCCSTHHEHSEWSRSCYVV